jgi:hypothetical protein
MTAEEKVNRCGGRTWKWEKRLRQHDARRKSDASREYHKGTKEKAMSPHVQPIMPHLSWLTAGTPQPPE